MYGRQQYRLATVIAAFIAASTLSAPAQADYKICHIVSSTAASHSAKNAASAATRKAQQKANGIRSRNPSAQIIWLGPQCQRNSGRSTCTVSFKLC